jgi:adenylate cyclase
MDWLSSIRTWLSDNQAAISAVAAMIVIAGVVFAGLRWLLSRRSQLDKEATLKPNANEDPLLTLPTGPVVAVLPFENLSRDLDQEYFSDGLTDDIITALSRFKDLFVIARNSTFRYKGQALDVRQLNRELGARYVLEGSVQRAGDTLRVTAQLLDAKDGTHLWAETYDRALSASNIFAVQDEVTEQAVATIAGNYGVISRTRFAEAHEKPTDSLDGYECVLRWELYVRDSIIPVEHAKLRDGLERAVKSDPDYADAWACLCHAYLAAYRLNFDLRPDLLDRALEAARRAVKSGPTCQRARVALAHAYFYRNDIETFAAEVERALALNPNNPAALASLGNALYFAGDERGIPLVEKAVELDPFHPSWLNFPIADQHFQRGEYKEALAAAHKIEMPGYFWIPLYLAGIYAELDRQAEARSALEELLDVYPGFTTETLTKEWRKWNRPNDAIRRWLDALRKAGLPD